MLLTTLLPGTDSVPNNKQMTVSRETFFFFQHKWDQKCVQCSAGVWAPPRIEGAQILGSCSKLSNGHSWGGLVVWSWCFLGASLGWLSGHIRLGGHPGAGQELVGEITYLTWDPPGGTVPGLLGKGVPATWPQIMLDDVEDELGSLTAWGKSSK